MRGKFQYRIKGTSSQREVNGVWNFKGVFSLIKCFMKAKKRKSSSMFIYFDNKAA